MEAAECGAASLAMILAYHGVYVPLEKLRIETGVSRDGCNAGNLLLAAEKYGLEGTGCKKSLDNLIKSTLPCMIHWNFNHFVVFEGQKGRFFYINDPGTGRRKITYEELDASFTGVVLEFCPVSGMARTYRPPHLLSSVAAQLRGERKTMLCLAALGLLLAFPGLFLPVLIQFFVDYLLEGSNPGWIAAFCAFMAAVILLRGVLSWYRALLLGRVQKKMSMLSAYRFLSHMLRLPMSFFEQRYAGDLSGRVESNNNIIDFLTGDLAETIWNLFTTVFYLILFFLYSPLLTGLVLANVLINAAAVRASLRLTQNETIKIQQDQGKLYGAVVAGIRIIDTLKASGSEEAYVRRILGNYAKTVRQEQKIGRIQQILSAVPDASGKMTEAAVILAGGLLVIRGRMTAGMLIAYVSLLGGFLAPIERLVLFISRIQTLRADLGRMEDIYHYEKDARFSEAEEEKPLPPKYEKLSGEIAFSEITFGYSPVEAPLLDHVSFLARPGETIGIAGPSGCGKSTVLKLIGGLYTPWMGEIQMDGLPLCQIRRDILAASVSAVSQEPTIFPGSIRDNLTMWNKSILEEDMIRAAKDACIHESILKKPGAYEYRLEEGGWNLSGGQRQRLEIARALACNPSILLMDEATSALDPLVEKQVMDNIRKRGCTCILVAHRLSAIRDCDRILVMDRGRIVQCGSHEEMKEEDGPYRQLLGDFAG